jgi:hypothetical protein
MKLLCPWCLGELPGKPGQVAKCRHCTSDIFWGGDEPSKTEEEALSASQATPDFEAATEAVIEPPPVPEKTQEDDFFDNSWLTSDSPGTTRKLSPEVAKVLARYDGYRSFVGDGIKSLTVDDANAILGTLAGEGWLRLNGLTKITPEVAEALAKCEHWLGLAGLTTITPEEAEALAKHEGHLVLGGLTSITPAVAEALAKCRGNLHLHKLLELNSVALPRKLASIEGRLGLYGLTTITPEEAEALAKHKGELSLWRLTTLTPEVAEALAKYKGHLDLDGLTSITPAVAQALAKHEGGLSLYSIRTYRITPEARKILRAIPHIRLRPEYKE